MVVYVFDVDGTIFDTYPAYCEVLNAFLSVHGRAARTNEEYRELFQLTPDNIFRELGIEQHKGEIKTRIMQKLSQGVPIFPGIDAVIEDLYDLADGLSILSTNYRSQVDLLFAPHQNLKRKFRPLLAYEDHKTDKTTSEGLQHICQSLAVQPHELVIIEDNVQAISTARNFGCKTVAVTWGFSAKEALAAEQPDVLAATPEEIYRITHT